MTEIFGPRGGGRISIVPYTDGWPARFTQERERLADALGAVASRIEHVGSTSVPGLGAKPIIDIVIAVVDIEDEDSFQPALVAAGYELRVREPGHRMFRTPAVDVHVHLWQEGDPEIDEMLMFRDWLRANAEDRARYEATKRQLAETVWADMQEYADAKTPVVAEIKERARRMTPG